MNKKVLVTGAAGFIGYHVTNALLSRGDVVTGIDNFNDYYDVKLKETRLAQIFTHKNANNFKFIKQDLAETRSTLGIFTIEKFSHVVHLATHAVVSYSIENPHTYLQSNLVALVNILEGCRHNNIEHLVYASSSGVYGGNTKIPFNESDNVVHPISHYVATNKSNDFMAHTYSHLNNLPTSGLRFFKLYGTRGRPDMSPFLFADEILKGQPINLFNHGDMMRYVTYIHDIVEGVVRVSDASASTDPSADQSSISRSALYRLFNIGNSQPAKLLDFLATLKKSIGKKTTLNMLPTQPGYINATFADVTSLRKSIKFKPKTNLKQGILSFVSSYINYYRVNNLYRM